MPNFQDLTGNKYGRLTVIKRAENVGKLTAWECVCECGNSVKVIGGHLKNGHTKSCGCLAQEERKKTRHGMTGKRLYRIWQGMKNRCGNENTIYYDRYGGRGISVCDEWEKSFEAFMEWSTKNGYKDDLSIDRIDNNKGYSPENCRWATKEEQANNCVSNVVLRHNGEEHTIAEWSKIRGINYQTLHSRIVTLGWSVEKALCR